MSSKTDLLLTEWTALNSLNQLTHYQLYWLPPHELHYLKNPIAEVPTDNSSLDNFKKVNGEGVHEIPVGPVHAGIIEPGHFRFSVVGEQILKLELQLGYTHKGIKQLLHGKTVAEGAKLIGRISGDTTVAYAYAYALACEKALSLSIDTSTQIIRALLLERERLMNHIGDIGAVIGDTALPSLHMQFSLLKEKMLRENAVLTGHRYMMDVIKPGEPIEPWSNTLIKSMGSNLSALQDELTLLQALYESHYGIEDRVKTTGILTQETAKKLGVLGVTAKASGLPLDMRQALSPYPYTALNFTPLIEKTGDVAARVMLRFKECYQSILLIQRMLALTFPTTPTSSSPVENTDFSLGIVEGWRGPICIAITLDNAHIRWCHFHDPSYQNWAALEYAVLGNIVADFPLINKSFNLSYSGRDG